MAADENTRAATERIDAPLEGAQRVSLNEFRRALVVGLLVVLVALAWTAVRGANASRFASHSCTLGRITLPNVLILLYFYGIRSPPRRRLTKSARPRWRARRSRSAVTIAWASATLASRSSLTMT